MILLNDLIGLTIFDTVGDYKALDLLDSYPLLDRREARELSDLSFCSLILALTIICLFSFLIENLKF